MYLHIFVVPIEMANGLHFSRTSTVPQRTLQRHLIHTPKGGCCHARCWQSHWDQLRVYCLFQGYNHLLQWNGIRTANLLVIGQPALPSESQSPRIRIRVTESKSANVWQIKTNKEFFSLLWKKWKKINKNIALNYKASAIYIFDW